MTKKYFHLWLGAMCALLATSSYANSLAWPNFRVLAENVPLIARVKIISKEAIKASDSSSEVCGYRIHANVEEMLKGPDIKDVTFLSKSSDDVLENYSEYLVIGFDRNSSDKKAKVQCDPASKYVVGDFEQTLFAISDDPETGKPEYLMVSRTSPFTTGNFVSVQGAYVETFAIESRHIYALVPWNKVIADLNTVRASQK